MQLCIRPDAQKKTQNYSPVSAEVVELVLRNTSHWDLNNQLIRFTKPVVNIIGNMESRDASLADGMIELLKCARILETLPNEDGDNLSFSQHARTTFKERFLLMNTDLHFLLLFLHPLCRRLAISNARLSRTFNDVVRIALVVANKWKWSQPAALQLVKDLKDYQEAKGVYQGGLVDGQKWWKNLVLDGAKHPIRNMAINLFNIVPHSAEVERLFSDLNSIQGKRRTALAVDTLRSLGRLRCHYRDILQERKKLRGEKVRRSHAHMHTRENGGVDVEAVDTLLDEESRVGLEDQTFLQEEIDQAFERLRRQDEEDWREGRSDKEIEFLNKVQGAKVSECYALNELDNVLAKKAPKPVEDNIEAHRGPSGAAGWNVEGLMNSMGL